MGSTGVNRDAPAPKRARWAGGLMRGLIGGLIVVAGVVAFYSGSPEDPRSSPDPSPAGVSDPTPSAEHDMDLTDGGPPPEQTLVFTGDEYSFAGPTEVREARTRIEFRNIGVEPHEISLARLASGTEVPDTLAEMDSLWADAQFGGVDAPVIVGGSHAIDPGEVTHVDLDLTSGIYLVSCPFPDPATSEYHFSKGMIQVLVVT